MDESMNYPDTERRSKKVRFQQLQTDVFACDIEKSLQHRLENNCITCFDGPLTRSRRTERMPEGKQIIFYA